VEALQELRFAANASGVEQQTLDMALQRFTRRAAEAAQGTGEEGLVNRVRLFCTLDDPRTGGYRFDYSPFIGMVIRSPRWPLRCLPAPPHQSTLSATNGPN
jgi:hypothetical protein